MKRKIAVAAALAATLLGAAACGSKGDNTPTTSASGPVDGKGKTIKVWLMVDAQTAWKGVVDDAGKRFTDATGAQVSVEYQQWPNHLTKLDATLAGSDVPDVVELGNTEFSKYVFNAGARVLIYRKDLFTAAGVTAAPKTYDEFLADADKLQTAKKSDPKFGAIYLPGKYWYSAMSFVKSTGGDIAKQDGGKWAGQLEQPASVQGLQRWVDLVKKYSKAGPAKDESDQAGIFAQGEAGMFYGNAWEQGAAEQVKKDPNDPNSALVDTKVKGKLAAAPMPDIPSFLGGSNLGVTQKSANKELAAQWIKYFTGSTSMAGLIKASALLNSTALLDQAATQNPAIAPAALAAKSSWFTPNADKWADVEKANILQTMLTDILTGKKTAADGAKWADDQINTTLNAS